MYTGSLVAKSIGAVSGNIFFHGCSLLSCSAVDSARFNHSGNSCPVRATSGFCPGTWFALLGRSANSYIVSSSSSLHLIHGFYITNFDFINKAIAFCERTIASDSLKDGREFVGSLSRMWRQAVCLGVPHCSVCNDT